MKVWMDWIGRMDARTYGVDGQDRRTNRQAGEKEGKKGGKTER